MRSQLGKFATGMLSSLTVLLPMSMASAQDFEVGLPIGAVNEAGVRAHVQ